MVPNDGARHSAHHNKQTSVRPIYNREDKHVVGSLQILETTHLITGNISQKKNKNDKTKTEKDTYRHQGAQVHLDFLEEVALTKKSNDTVSDTRALITQQRG